MDYDTEYEDDWRKPVLVTGTDKFGRIDYYKTVDVMMEEAELQEMDNNMLFFGFANFDKIRCNSVGFFCVAILDVNLDKLEKS